MSGLRVVLAEDDVLLREGLASLLGRSGFDVVGQAGDSTQLLTLVHEKAPALVVVDIRMPPTHTAEGLEAARHIRQEHPETGILVLSAHIEVESLPAELREKIVAKRDRLRAFLAERSIAEAKAESLARSDGKEKLMSNRMRSAPAAERRSTSWP